MAPGLNRAHTLYLLAFNIVVFGRLGLLEDIMAAAMTVGATVWRGYIVVLMHKECVVFYMIDLCVLG